MPEGSSLAAWCGRVIVTHFLTYSLVGAIFFAIGLNVIVYYESNPDPALQRCQEIFRATDSALVVNRCSISLGVSCLAWCSIHFAKR